MVVACPLEGLVRKQARNEGGMEHQSRSSSILCQRIGFALECAKEGFACRQESCLVKLLSHERARCTPSNSLQ